MATIFQKVTGDNCVILDPRESLIYPFNFGDDWTEIRMGVYVSMCATGDDNSLPIFSTISDNSAINRPFIGFKNNNNSFPQSASCSFAGFSSPITEGTILQIAPGTSSAGLELAGSSSNTYSFLLSNDASQVKDSAGGFSSMQWPYAGSVGDTAYFGVFVAKLCVTPTNIYTGTNYVTHNATAGGSNVGIASLRKDVANASFSSPVTGFFTYDFTATGTPIAKPNAAFIYSPMFNSRLRIHNIVVERYR